MITDLVKNPVRGAGGGGGGGGQSAPVEAPDSLHSFDMIYMLDALGEGEWEGLVNGLKSAYINGTPIQNPDGSFNFKNVTLSTTHGTPNQPYIPIIADVESEVPVGIKITTAAPVVRTITDPNVNACRVRLSTNGMEYQDASGNLSGTVVQLRIEVQTNGGGFVVVLDDSFNGKTTSKYDRGYRIPLTGTGPWDIRVTRLTADSLISTLRNDIYFDALASIIDQKLNYPYTVLAAWALDARTLGNASVTRGYDMKMGRVQVPVNYDPIARTYTGLWDGTFKTAWTDNPAWGFYNLMSNTRYGLGKYFDPALLDKWTLYKIAQYCDELVADGYGGMEPRFTLNAYLQTREDAFKVMNSLASVFRGMVYWASGRLTAEQDAPQDPVMLFHNSNVLGGKFNYSGVSRRARHTVAMVTWNNPLNAYKQEVERVEDADGIAQFGEVQTSLVAFGCTSRGQAHRAGKWLLYTEKYESELMTFSASLDSSFLRPGKIISVQDSHRVGKRMGGRLASTGTTTAQLVIDAAIIIETGKIYTASVVLPDGTIGSSVLTNAAGAATVLTLATVLAAVPQPNAMWVVGVSDLAIQQYRILSVSEPAKNEYAVTALKFYPGKFNLIENGIKLETPPTMALSATPGAVQNIVITESLVKVTGLVRTKMTVAWDKSPGASGYRVKWRPTGGNWSTVPDTPALSVDVIDTPVGNVDVSVQAVNPLGMPGASYPASATLLGKTAPPANVSGFWVTRQGDTLFYSMTESPDLDFGYFEIRLGATWDTAQVFMKTPLLEDSKVSAQGGTFLCKAVDTSGNYSLIAAQDIVAENSNINVVVIDDDATYGWPGVLTNMVKDGASLTLGYGNTWNSLTQPWNSYVNSWMKESAPLASGNYITDLHDIGAVLDCRLSVLPVIDAIALEMTWNSLALSWNSYANNWTWQGPIGAITATYEINTSLDNVTWTGWQPFIPGLMNLRYYKMRATFSAQPGYQVRLNHFPITVDVPDRLDKYSNLAVPITGITETFATPFNQAQRAFVTIKNGVAGDSYAISLTNSGFTLTIYNAALAAKAGTADIEISGY